MASSGVDPNLKLLELCTKKAWWTVPHLIKLNLLLLVPFATSYVGGFDASMLNGLQTVTYWQEYFDHPRGAMLGLMSNMQTIGGVVSLPFAPFVADKFGRRLPIFFGSIVIILGALLQGCATNFGMFASGRFCIGLGAGFVATAAPTLLGELAYPTHRPIITAMYNSTWALGAIVAAWTTYGTFAMPNNWSWRIPSLLQCLVSVFQLGLIYMLPESPRYLVANGRTADATRVLNIHHTGADEPNELVRLQVAEITAAIEFERSLESSSYLQFIRTKGNRHRLLITASFGFIIQACGNQLVGGYLALVLIDSGITSPKTQNLINGGLQIFNFLIACISATLVERLGRRFLLLFSSGGMLLSFTVWTALAARNQQSGGEQGLAIGVVVVMFIFCFFYATAMAPLPIAYLLEILPYTLRTKGLTIFNLMQYTSGITNGFVNPVGIEALRWRYYIVFIVALVIWTTLFYFFYPETRGLTLEEVSQIFDGRQALERAYDIKDEVEPETAHSEKGVSGAVSEVKEL